MGRKKIEIRPLTDERNRNVTFLKRKAGLMKKAWELSVLCGAEVSILIFSAAGKPYEFSSRDLDSEIDRYLDYEGMIERRRGEEFAAMNEAGEDDDDDDEDDRRGSTSKAGAKGAAAAAAVGADGTVKVGRSLKGKESYKQKMLSRRELAKAVEKRGKKRGRRDDGRGKQGFIDGLLSDSEGDGEDSNSRESSDMANLNYAMNMPPSLSGSMSMPVGSGMQAHGNYQSPNSYYRSSSVSTSQQQFPIKADPGSYPPNSATQSYSQPGMTPLGGPQSSGGMGTMGMGSASQMGGMTMPYPPTMGGVQWDQGLLQRYAEFQLQQNHQKQQRALLDKQRQQLADLGVPVGMEEERRLLDDILGMGSGSSGGGGGGERGQGGYTVNAGQDPRGQAHSGVQGEGSGQDEFVWPSFGQSGPPARVSGGGGGSSHHHPNPNPPQRSMSGGTPSQQAYYGAQSSHSGPSQGQSPMVPTPDRQSYFQGQGGGEEYDRYPPNQGGWMSGQPTGGSMDDRGYSQYQGDHPGSGGAPGQGQIVENQFPSPVSYEEGMKRRRPSGPGGIAPPGTASIPDLGGIDKRIRVG